MVLPDQGILEYEITEKVDPLLLALAILLRTLYIMLKIILETTMITQEDMVDQVLIALRKIIRAIDLHSRKLIKSYGLTIPQVIVLKEIERNDSPTVGEIATSVSLSQATVTNILIRLEQHGYLIRTQHDNDRRCVVVNSTEAGRDILARAPSLLHDKFVSSFQELKNWEQTMIISSLQRIAELMNVQDVDAAPVLSPGAELPVSPDKDREQISSLEPDPTS